VVKYSSWTSPTFLLALQKNPAPQASVKERLQQEKRRKGENLEPFTALFYRSAFN